MKRILTTITLLTAVFISSMTASTVYAQTDAYKYMRIIEEWGSGIPRMFNEFSKYGFKEPAQIDIWV